MRLMQSRPGGCATAPAPNDCYQRESYPPTHNPQAINDLGVVFAWRVVEAERTLLSAGLWDPPGLHEHAYAHDLEGWHFVLPAHSFICAYLCSCVDAGDAPSDNEALQWAQEAGVTLTDSDLNYIIATDHDPRLWTEYVETVVENARNFARAQECLREAVGVLIGTVAYDFDIIIRSRVQPRQRAVR